MEMIFFASRLVIDFAGPPRFLFAVVFGSLKTQPVTKVQSSAT